MRKIFKAHMEMMITYLESLQDHDLKSLFQTTYNTFYRSSFNSKVHMSILSTYLDDSKSIPMSIISLTCGEFLFLVFIHTRWHVTTLCGHMWHPCRVTCGIHVEWHVERSRHMHEESRCMHEPWCDHNLIGHMHGLNYILLVCMHGSKSEVVHGANNVVCFR